MRLPEINFSNDELEAYVRAPEASREAVESLVGAAVKEAEEFVAGASSDRDCAVGQGMLLVALQLRETLLGAPARHAELATRKPSDGTSPGLEGFM